MVKMNITKGSKIIDKNKKFYSTGIVTKIDD